VQNFKGGGSTLGSAATAALFGVSSFPPKPTAPKPIRRCRALRPLTVVATEHEADDPLSHPLKRLPRASDAHTPAGPDPPAAAVSLDVRSSPLSEPLLRLPSRC
jgi:hypothetical protein